jgi:hypothetical protein
LLDPHVEAGPESLEVTLLGWDEIPWDDLAFPTVDWVLREARAQLTAEGPVATVFNPSGREG